MRELKFRAWDDTKKEWTLNIMECVSSSRVDIWLEPALKSHEVIIEQYTGLKDKNGKEIYIGDVVSEHHGDIVGDIVQKPSGEYHISWVGIFGGESVLYDHLSLCEVIGNIHENPELIEKERE